MRAYVIRKLMLMIPILLGIVVVSFVIVHIAPGDPTTVMVSPKIKPADLARIKSNLGLEEPLSVQFVKWFRNVLQFDFGVSFISGRKVSDVLKEKIPNTLLLMGTGIFVALVTSIFLGTLSAVKYKSVFDWFISLVTIFGISIPVFWLALTMIMLFSVELGWLPATGMYNLKLDQIKLWDRIAHMIMPVFCIATPRIARWTRYIRANMLEVIHQDYILTAKSKGLQEKVVIYKHALKNAMIPMVTLLGLSLPAIIGGSFIIESIFGWPGMGLTAVDAVFQRDYPVILAINTISAIMVLVCNFLADIAYAYLDPRVRYS